METFGTISAQRYVGLDTQSTSGNPVRVFRVRFSRTGIRPMSFSLQKNPAADDPGELPWHFGTFSFTDATPRIERMIERAR